MILEVQKNYFIPYSAIESFELNRNENIILIKTNNYKFVLLFSNMKIEKIFVIIQYYMKKNEPLSLIKLKNLENKDIVNIYNKIIREKKIKNILEI